VANIPVLQALAPIARNTGPIGGTRGAVANRVPTLPAPATTSSGAVVGVPRRDVGRAIRNTQRDARFTSNTPFPTNVLNRRVTAAIALEGNPPQHFRGGESNNMCVSYHAKGLCFENCERAADHVPMTEAETTEFREWCSTAYA
jgi:hypothetical protein